MSTASISAAYVGTTAWFAQGGLADTEDYDATAHARRLVRYISDASTVRARTLDRYGTAPPIATIRKMRDSWTGIVAARAASRTCANVPDEPELMAGDDEYFDDISDAIAALAVRSQRAAQPPRRVVVAAPGLPVVLPPPLLIPVTQREILARCAAVCGLTAEDILGKSRKAVVVRARQFVTTVLRARGNSYPMVGRYLGGVDHSTVIHSVRTFFNRGIQDPAYVTAWMSEAPCAMKMVRSVQELDMLLAVRR